MTVAVLVTVVLTVSAAIIAICKGLRLELLGRIFPVDGNGKLYIVRSDVLQRFLSLHINVYTLARNINRGSLIRN